MNDTYRLMKERSKVKRAHNKSTSTQFLVSSSIEFRSNDEGTHLIIDEYNTGVIDYWPSTGLWIPRNTKKRHRGIRPLIKYIQGE